jgi:hypothetical protein
LIHNPYSYSEQLNLNKSTATHIHLRTIQWKSRYEKMFVVNMVSLMNSPIAHHTNSMDCIGWHLSYQCTESQIRNTQAFNAIILHERLPSTVESESAKIQDKWQHTKQPTLTHPRRSIPSVEDIGVESPYLCDCTHHCVCCQIWINDNVQSFQTLALWNNRPYTIMHLSADIQLNLEIHKFYLNTAV